MSDANDRLAAIVESAADAIVGVGLDGVIASWNAAAERLFGLRAAEAVGQPVHIVAPDRAAELAAALASVRDGAAVLRLRSVRVDADGQELHVELTLSPVHDGAGALAGASIVARDIGEHARAEARSRMAVEDLEQFAHAASHDLQEPLRMISSFTQLIGERYQDVLDDRGRQYIEFAQDGARRMRQLLLGLLAYSRVRSRGKPLAPVDARGCLEQALRSVGTAVHDTGATIEHDVDARVLADDVQLELVFQQLLANALEFRREQPPKISITVAREGPRWRFAVRDNGLGIAPEHADRVFGIFERLHTRDQHPGIGIGLALCRRIVERHAGRLWLESDGATGSTFLFTLSAAGHGHGHGHGNAQERDPDGSRS